MKFLVVNKDKFKKNTITVLKVICQCTWGIIQTLAGALFLLYTAIMGELEKVVFIDGVIYCKYKSNFGSISLGLFVFVTDYEAELMAHETGHTVQSILVGPLYLLVIGLPSIIWASFLYDLYKKEMTYYEFYTEKWANYYAGLDKNGKFIAIMQRLDEKK